MGRRVLIIIMIAVAWSTGNLYAQVEIQGDFIAPIAPTAYFLKPAPGGEIRFSPGDIDQKLRFDISVGYYAFKPTRDTFPTITVASGGRNALLPGYDVPKSYTVIPIGFGALYRPLETKLSPFVRLEGYFYLIDYSYHSNVETLLDGDFDEGYWELAIVPQLGASYKLGDNCLLSAGFGYSLGITGTIDTQTYWKSFLEITFLPD